MSIDLHYRDHKFSPAVLVVPAGKPINLTVHNDADEAMEFESFRLHIEVVIGPGRTTQIQIPSTRKGTYDFTDDFDSRAVEGEIRVQ